MKALSRLLTLALLAAVLPAAAAEVTLVASQGVAAVLEALTPEFERVSGDRLVTRIGLSGALKKEIAAGAAFDVTILSRDHIQALAAEGSVAAGSARDIASSGVGIAMRRGAARPPLANQEDFKTLLLTADSFAFSATGASGVYFQQLVERLGLTEAIRNKLRPQTSGSAAEVVARGEAEYGVQMVSELKGVAGTELVGPLPPDLQMTTIFSAGISARAANPAGARRLIDFLTAPARAPLIEAKGMQKAN